MALTSMRSAWLSVTILVACGSSFDAAAPDARPVADADAAGVADAAAGPTVPEPGTGPLPRSWPDMEPNDTPEQAVRLGTGSGQIGPYVGLSGDPGHIGGADPADYFVFRTAAGGSDTQWIASACWDPTLQLNLLDFALYKVVDGKPLVTVSASSGSDTACKRQDPFSIPLEPDTKYLFAVFHVEGEGSYTA